MIEGNNECDTETILKPTDFCNNSINYLNIRDS